MQNKARYAKLAGVVYEYGYYETDCDDRRAVKEGTAKTLEEAMKRNGMTPMKVATSPKKGDTQCSGKSSVPSYVRPSRYSVPLLQSGPLLSSQSASMITSRRGEHLRNASVGEMLGGAA